MDRRLTQEETAKYLAQRAQDEQRLRAHLDRYQQPLDLYGVVLEEQTQTPIAGVRVRLQPIDKPGIGSKDSPPTIVQTDAQGRFDYTGHRGLELNVEVTKPGYYTLVNRSYTMFVHEGEKPSQGIRFFATNPAEPARLYLRQAGSTPAKLVYHDLRQRLPRGGTPSALDLAVGTLAPAGRGELQIECQDNDQGLPTGTPFDWSCRLSVLGGGLQERTDEFAFQAPESGYQPSQDISMPAVLGKDHWRDTVTRDFFLHLANGSYARVNIKIMVGGGHSLHAIYYYNPTVGDRNLEANPGTVTLYR